MLNLLSVKREYVDDRRILFDEVPCISLKFSPDALDNARRAVDGEGRFLPEPLSEKEVKADKMVHMHMGDEDIGYPVHLRWGECADIPEVKEQRIPLPEEPDIQTGVSKRVVDEAMAEEWFHQIIQRSAGEMNGGNAHLFERVMTGLHSSL